MPDEEAPMVRRNTSRCALALAIPLSLACASYAGVASAQDTTQGTPPVLPPRQPDARSVPEKVDPPLNGNDPAATGTTLSDQLRSSEGVIRPPGGVDPEMHVPAPQNGSGVVIPPPGSNPDDPVQPK
jgi:hypothetical protein